MSMPTSAEGAPTEMSATFKELLSLVCLIVSLGTQVAHAKSKPRARADLDIREVTSTTLGGKTFRAIKGYEESHRAFLT